MTRLLSCLLLAAFPAAHGADCVTAVEDVQNKDGSRFRLEQVECKSSRTRTISVTLRQANNPRPQQLLRLKQSLDEAPHGNGYFLDLENDGTKELLVVGECGAGANCSGRIYKVAASRKSMYLMFDGGSNLSVKDGYLVDGGRSGCCSAELHFYKLPPRRVPLTYSDMDYMVTFSTSSDEDAEHCRVSAMNGRFEIDIPPSIRKFCEPQ